MKGGILDKFGGGKSWATMQVPHNTDESAMDECYWVGWQQRKRASASRLKRDFSFPNSSHVHLTISNFSTTSAEQLSKIPIFNVVFSFSF